MNTDVILKLKNASMLSEQELTPELISTGSYALNKIISGKYNGGVPIGMITQFIGQASTAKTVFGIEINQVHFTSRHSCIESLCAYRQAIQPYPAAPVAQGQSYRWLLS